MAIIHIRRSNEAGEEEASAGKIQAFDMDKGTRKIRHQYT